MRIIRKSSNFNNVRKPIIRKAVKKAFSRSKDEVREAIIENGVATEEECDLVTDICGYSLKALNDIIEVRTGYEDIEQYLGEDEEEDFACGGKGKKKFAEGYDAEWKESENEKHARLIAELKEKAQKKLDNGLDEMKVRLWLKEAIKQENNRYSNAYQDRYGH